MKRDPMRFITRMDYERTHAWWVRFQRSSLVQRSFADGKYGSKAAALRAAQAWRDQQEPLAPRSRARSEVFPGHHYFRRISYRGSTCWLCWLRVERRGAKVCRRSVAVHGEAQARSLCEQWLEAEMQALHSRLRARSRWKPSPEARVALRRWQRMANQ